jgi:hypothetical protein
MNELASCTCCVGVPTPSSRSRALAHTLTLSLARLLTHTHSLSLSLSRSLYRQSAVLPMVYDIRLWSPRDGPERVTAPAPHRCLIGAPWLVPGGHGASITRRL